MDTPPENSENSDSSETPEAEMTAEPVIEPIAGAAAVPTQAHGRLADKLAAMVAATALALSLLLSALFFAGFAANDYHIFAITSALGLSLFLGAFAIVPMAILVILARRAYRYGGNLQIYLWALLLILPWMALSIICLIYTPLPIWMSLLTVLFAAVLTIWSLISFCLTLKDRRK